MRIEWSNRIRIVESYLKQHRLKPAKDMARRLLNEDHKVGYLMSYESSFLIQVVKAERIEDLSL